MPIPLGILAVAGAGAAGSPPAFDLLETTILSSATSTVTFSNLNTYSDYKHLQFRIVTRATDTGTSTGFLDIRLNGVTSSSYARHTLNGRGDTVRSSSNSSWSSILSNIAIPLGSSASSAFSGTVLDILDFNNANKRSRVACALE